MVAYSNFSTSEMSAASVETLSLPIQELLESRPTSAALVDGNPPLQISKQAIRSSLKASTLDGIFSAVFASITGGVLLSNFLLKLGATSVEIGMLSSFPMLVNLLQPLGAYLADRTTSRLRYGLWIFCPSRLLWLILVLGIWLVSQGHTNPHQLVGWTLAMVFTSHVVGALGCPSWLSWMATLVPRRLRGRYFGIRNSAASLTTLLCVPLLGLAVSTWPGGTIQGYGALLLLGVVFGLLSLVCQLFMADVNPQQQARQAQEQPLPQSLSTEENKTSSVSPIHWSLFKEANFLRFLLYFGLWAFAVNVSNPFFNLYMLDNLAIDVKWVTIYNSLTAGANLLMLILWGKLADRIGNRLLLLLVGIVVAVTPLFWLGAGRDSLSLWVWLPLLHLLGGGTWAAIDLCSNNMQMDVAPTRNQASYFAIAAAVAGVSGAIGTTAGGFLAQFADYGGLPGLFALSSVLRLAALFPLVFVREHGGHSFGQLMGVLHQTVRNLLVVRVQSVSVPTGDLINQSK